MLDATGLIPIKEIDEMEYTNAMEVQKAIKVIHDTFGPDVKVTTELLEEIIKKLRGESESNSK